MSIRVECDLEGCKDCWIDFRERPWLFGDRRKVIGASDDAGSLDVIFDYAEGWNLKDAEGRPVPLPPKEGNRIGVLDNVEDRLALWLVRAWFEARAKALALPKATS